MNFSAVNTPARALFADPQITQVLESLTDGYMTFDEEWRFTFISPKCETLLQLPPGLLGKYLWQEFQLLQDTQFFSASHEALATRKTIKIEEVCPYTGIWIESYIQPCQDGVTIYYRDITERLRAKEEQSRFAAILAATPDFVCIHDTQYQQIYVNQAGREMLQLGQDEEVAGVPFHPRWASDLILTTGIPIAMREGIWLGETALLRRDGAEIPVSQLIIAHKNAQGEVSFISTIARDMTARIKAENQVREQAALLDHSPDAIMVCDLNYQIVYWNKGAERLYGWSAAEAKGQPIHGLLCAENTQEKFFTVQDQLREKGEWRGEGKHCTKTKSEIYTYSHWSVVHDKDGQKKSYLVIHSDITEKKKLEEQFLRAQRLESIGTLANGIAHDLNNILSPILLATRILSLKFTDDDSQQLLSTLRRSAERGADLVRQVLTYVRGADGERVLFQVRQPIYEAVRILRETLPKTIELDIRLPADLWAIRGDMTQLYQIVMNLCLNARDAMPEGGKLTVTAENYVPTETVGVGLTKPIAGEYVLIRITDSGTGIAPEIKDKIFEPFFTTKTHGQGSGLGLATVLGIVKGHHGVVEIDSALGRGTTFNIYFPASVEKVAVQARAEALELPRGKGETILVVDDEYDILNMTSETLMAYGYKTLIANGGDEAIRTFEKNAEPIHLVLVDMMMPRMDGVATIRALKQINPAVKFITTSGLADNKKITEANELGASAFLAKPCLPGKMIQTIATVLES